MHNWPEQKPTWHNPNCSHFSYDTEPNVLSLTPTALNKSLNDKVPLYSQWTYAYACGGSYFKKKSKLAASAHIHNYYQGSQFLY